MIKTERLACVTLPDFAYQVAVKRTPALENGPAVVAERGGDSSPLFALNNPARQAFLSFDMTVAQARNRCADLKVIVRNQEEEAEASGRLLKQLQQVGPFIEESCPGLYYLQASGLLRLYGDEAGLARKIIAELQAQEMQLKTGLASNKLIARIAAGLAGVNRYVGVPSGEERGFLKPLQVEHLFLPVTGPLKSETVSKLHDLGIHTVGQLAALPPNEITHRFGAELLSLARYARGEDRTLLKPKKPTTRLEHKVSLDFPIRNIPQLMTHLEQLLEEVLGMLSVAYKGAKEIVWQFKYDDRSERSLTVGLESAGRSKRLFLRQTERLLEQVDLSAGVTDISVTVPSVQSLLSEQLPLQATAPVNDAKWISPELKGCNLFRVKEKSGFLPEESYELVPFDFSKINQRSKRSEKSKGKGEVGSQKNNSSSLINRPFASGSLSGLRLLRPPEKIRLENEGQKLLRLTYERRRYRIVSQRGPWKLSGGWQFGSSSPGQRYNRIYFELSLDRPGRPGLTVLVFYDRLRLAWFLQAFFD